MSAFSTSWSPPSRCTRVPDACIDEHGHMAADSVTLPAGVDEGLRAKQPERIAGMFDAIAPRYDFLNRVLSAGLDQRWRAQAIAALRLQPADVLLDVCTGTADVALAALASSAPPGRVVGVDFSREMLRLGLLKTRRGARESRLLLAEGDAAA